MSKDAFADGEPPHPGIQKTSHADNAVAGFLNYQKDIRQNRVRPWEIMMRSKFLLTNRAKAPNSFAVVSRRCVFQEPRPVFRPYGNASRTF
jgi:hypothetical protein